MDEQAHAARAARALGGGDRGRLRAVVRSADRHRSIVTLVVVVALVVVTGWTGIGAILARSDRHSAVHSPAATCTAPDAPPSAIASSQVGGWPYNLLVAGTFASVTASSSSLYALQACGAQETELRVLELAVNGRVEAVSGGFARAALLTSSLTLAGGSLYVGTARLDLAGPTDAGPYVLTLYRLDPSTLRVLGSRSLGRGYGLFLVGTGGEVLASTGSSLLAVQGRSLSWRRLASFGSSIAQHMAVSDSSPDVAVSLFDPGSSGAATGGRIELLDDASGAVVAVDDLDAGAAVESMAFGADGLFAAIGTGGSSEVRRLDLPGLSPAGGEPGTPTGLAATLESITLDGTGGIVWASELTALVCLDPLTGAELASTTPKSPVTEVVAAGADDIALTGPGIGVLAAPAGCRAPG
ncbi:MAG: hypothetical protein ABSH30_05115 [Acidimicrobiales bacterium]